MSLSFPENSFDAAFALESVVHMDRLQVLRQLARVVRPGGRIVLTDLFQRNPVAEGQLSVLELIAQLWLLSPAITLDDYPALVLDAGLQMESLRDVSEEVLPKSFENFMRQLRDGDHSMIPEEIIG